MIKTIRVNLVNAVLAVFVLMLTASASNGQKRIEVLEVNLRPGRYLINAPCPATITFYGTVRINEGSGSGSVDYGFLRSGVSAKSQPLTLAFKNGETVKKIETTWTLGESHKGWMKIKAKGRENATDVYSSEKAGAFSLVCTKP